MIEDISTLQNMVKKRDDIIKTLQDKLDSQESGEQTDYEELVLQLKAATGEITRLQADNDTLESAIELQKETIAAQGQEITRLEGVETERVRDIVRLGKENDELSKQIERLNKQLDQECDTNAELEDKMKEGVRALEAGDVTLVGKTQKDYEDEIQKLEDFLLNKDTLHKESVERNKLLEEKLAMCDQHYKEKEIFLQKIRNLITSE